jgi:C4-dicarboxylate transporter DctM subunit
MITVLFLSFFLLMAIGVPIAVCLGFAATIAILYSGLNVPLIVSVQMMYQGISSYQMLAVPFFILAGNLMTNGGLSEKFVRFLGMFFMRFWGGLANVSIVASMFFAAISGSNAATTAAIGGIMIPEMEKNGYDRGFTAATVAAAGCVGQVIPPSIPMVTYCVIAGTSVSTLFLAGVIPGVMMGISMMVYATCFCIKHKVPLVKDELSMKTIIKTTLDSIWALITPVIILGGIYSGLFTATEAGAIGCVYAAFCAFFIYQEITITDIPKILCDSAISSAVIMIIMGCVSFFSYVLSRGHIPQTISENLLSLTSNRYILLIFFNLILVVAGMFMNASAAIALLTPLLLPTLVNIGISPYLIGIVTVVNLGIGSITPPVGNNLYIASDIGRIPFAILVRDTIPYMLMLFIVLAMVTYVDQFSLWLPSLMGLKLN